MLMESSSELPELALLLKATIKLPDLLRLSEAAVESSYVILKVLPLVLKSLYFIPHCQVSHFDTRSI